ncbi:putative Zinc-type alcohol dehydrogenase-like protein [Glarea lozoyensis 74030]|uniref:Putative Zinc-type alcohol dehydrogenase-like protein n=1 Tax=Glarea lozoyensis (strain ATCC 74030 / MF5533) TaxID=1104152 RepID=H0EVC1_GLAL7|nr:putative Zinc-type alcohol dehydrogenase-like protein [Glarea lozoyensis 74030]
MSTMKALLLTKTGETPILSYTTVPKPTLTPGHLLIKVKASAIQPSDLINSKGGFPLTIFPRIPGRDFSGIVVEGPQNLIGTEVFGTSGNKQAFTTDGAQAEYILVPEAAVAPKPKTLRRSGAKKDDFVLVIGANGAVGSAVVQLAKGKGCKVLEASRQESADVNTASDPQLSAIDALTNGQGVAAIIDTVGQPALTSAAVAKLARGGTLAFIAGPRGGNQDLTFNMVDFYRGERNLAGVNTLLYSAEEYAVDLRGVGEMFDGNLLVPGSEWKQVRLEEGVAGYESAAVKGAGKFVVVMD